jgi:hypothetical protein
MNSGAVDADEDTVGDGGPCWIFSVAIEANLIGESGKTRKIRTTQGKIFSVYFIEWLRP